MRSTRSMEHNGIPCHHHKRVHMLDTTFQQHLTLYRNRIFRAAVGYLGNEEDAREAAQETLLKAYRSRARYDAKRPFYPWLYRIMKNTCLDAKARRSNRAAPGLDAERVPTGLLGPLEQAEQTQAIERLRLALELVSVDQREIINLRHFQDLSYAEIAQILGIAEGTVMSRLYRARKALVQAMEDTA